jgi:hypothetical protein
VSHCGCSVFRSSRCYIVLVVSLAIVFPVLCHFCTVSHLSMCDGQLLPRSTVYLGPNFPEFPFLPCHSCTEGHLPAGGKRLPTGFMITLGCFLHFLAGLCDWRADRTLLPRSSDWHYCGVFLGDILMLLYGLHHSWIGLSLRRFSAGVSSNSNRMDCIEVLISCWKVSFNSEPNA